MTPPPLIRFAGRVTCRVGTCVPLGLMLTGRTLDEAGVTQVSFNCSAPAQFPATLENATVQQVQPLQQAPAQRYRIAADSRAWLLEAAGVHLHRDVGRAFYAAVPPRRVPLRKRLFWRLILLLAATAPGRYLLTHRN